MADNLVPDVFADLPGYALRRAANAMMTDLSGRLAPLDLRISDVALLLLVEGRHDMTSSDIGRVLDIQRANMVPLLKRLTGAGLVERRPLDGKSMAIVLTDAGRERLARTRTIIEKFEADLLERVPAEHRPHLVPALKALF